MKYQHLSKTEEKLMTFLWDQAQPLSVPEMLERWDDKAWTDNYMRVILKSLEKKGAVEFYDLDHRGSKYARRFRATLSREEYYAQLACSNGVTVRDVAQIQAVAMVQKGGREGMEELIRELEDMIEEYRARDEDE